MTFTVVQNDDPYGLFAFAADSREVTVAEDFEDGDENSTFVDLYIERRQGTASVVKVRVILISKITSLIAHTDISVYTHAF